MQPFHLLLSILLPVTLAQQSNLTAQDATAFSLTYGYPLLAFYKLASNFINTIGVNQLYNARVLATSDFRAVVKPNVDTIYSTCIFDLSHSDLVIEIPDIPEDQYVLVSYYDPFGNNFANTGTGTPHRRLSYELTLRGEGDAFYGVVSEVGIGPAPIYSPSTYGVILWRWLVNSTNLETLHEYQDQVSITNTTDDGAFEERNLPYLQSLEGPDASLSPAANVLNLLSEFQPARIGPEIASDAARVNRNLATAGITAQGYTQPPKVDLSAANSSAVVSAALGWINNQQPLNNGWSVLQSNKTGDFGTNYDIRTAIASAGYLMLEAPNAVYPGWENASAPGSAALNGISLGPQESLLYTFSGKPPLQDVGFWSLTAYEDNYLIPNDRDVYALGDRSNLTYPSGAPVYGQYGAGANEEQDGEFQILVQPADVTPPANWTSNWLPAPAGGGDITVLLRWYVAMEAALDGEYVYPVIARQAAVVGGGSNRTMLNGTMPNATVPSNGSGASGVPKPYIGAASGPVLGSVGSVVGSIVLGAALLGC